MTAPPFLELAERWRRKAADMRELGAEPTARCLEKCAGDVEEAVRAWRLEELTLEEAAEAVGLSYSSVQKKVNAGDIPNVGRKHRPRVEVGDLVEHALHTKRAAS